MLVLYRDIDVLMKTYKIMRNKRMSGAFSPDLFNQVQRLTHTTVTQFEVKTSQNAITQNFQAPLTFYRKSDMIKIIIIEMEFINELLATPATPEPTPEHVGKLVMLVNWLPVGKLKSLCFGFTKYTLVVHLSYIFSP